jgi:vancomycin permeability regulator SanA
MIIGFSQSGKMLPVFIKIINRSMRLILYTVVIAFAVISISRIIVLRYASTRVSPVEEIDPQPVAVVFGAGLWRDGSPTPVLRDRVRTAADLYFAGKVDVLLMSGDNRIETYNEPAAMRTYAQSLGIPDANIVLDYAGRRTYDTCFRAKEIFGVKKAILVTQKFHLSRAVYTCNILGIEASGVPADQRQYRRRALAYWQLREFVATIVAMWEVHITQPLPVLGVPEPINIIDHSINQDGDNS